MQVLHVLQLTDDGLFLSGFYGAASMKYQSVARMGPARLPYVIVHTILPPSQVILWIELGGKSKWLPLNFGYNDVMRTAPMTRPLTHVAQR